MKFWLNPNGGPTAFMVREFLDLDAKFTAFGGLPVAREWRFFVDKCQVFCYHPYWPIAALEDKVKDCEDWKNVLASDFHLMRPGDLWSLSIMSIHLAEKLGGRWSVDFAMDRTGKWWLIDCARMEDSWHWPGCRNANGQEDEIGEEVAET